MMRDDEKKKEEKHKLHKTLFSRQSIHFMYQPSAVSEVCGSYDNDIEIKEKRSWDKFNAFWHSSLQPLKVNGLD